MSPKKRRNDFCRNEKLREIRHQLHQLFREGKQTTDKFRKLEEEYERMIGY